MNTNLFSIKIFLLVASFSALLGGCSSHQRALKNIDSPLANTDVKSISDLDRELASAKEQNVNLLAADSFVKAEDACKKPLADYRSGKNVDQKQDCLDEAREYLRRAKISANTRRTQVSPLLAEREKAIARNGASTPEFERVEKNFAEAMTQMDRNPNAYQERFIPKLTDQYRALGNKAYEQQYLSKAAGSIAEAKRAGAKEFVPQTLQEVERNYQQVKAAIAGQGDLTTIDKAGSTLEFESSRLLSLTRQAKANEKKSPEQRVLDTERLLQSVQVAMMAEDLRDQPFEAQANLMTKQASEMASQVATSGTQIKTLQGTVNETQTQLSETERQKQKLMGFAESAEIQKRISEVRAIFDPKQAEVVQDGQKVIVRLKAMKFLSGKSTVPETSYEFLGKVASSIKKFPASNITIEGHADAVGTAELNKTLSQARADSVRAYFMSLNDTTLESRNVDAIGYGFDRPIASNKTAEGRAANRRIDLVINLNATPKDSQSRLSPQ